MASANFLGVQNTPEWKQDNPTQLFDDLKADLSTFMKHFATKRSKCNSEVFALKQAEDQIESSISSLKEQTATCRDLLDTEVQRVQLLEGALVGIESEYAKGQLILSEQDELQQLIQSKIQPLRATFESCLEESRDLPSKLSLYKKIAQDTETMKIGEGKYTEEAKTLRSTKTALQASKERLLESINNKSQKLNETKIATNQAKVKFQEQLSKQYEFGKSIEASSQELKETNKRIEALRIENLALLRDKESNTKYLEQEIKRYKELKLGLQPKKDAVEKLLEEKKRQKQELLDLTEALTVKKCELKSAVSEALRRSTKLQLKDKQLQVEAKVLETDLIKRNSELDTLELSLEAVVTKYERAKKSLEATKEMNENLKLESDSLINRKNALESEKRELEVQISKQQQQAKVLKENEAETLREMEAMRERSDAANQAKFRVQQLVEGLEAIRLQHEDRRARLRNFYERIEKLKAQLKSAETTETNMQTYCSSLKRARQGSKQNQKEAHMELEKQQQIVCELQAQEEAAQKEVDGLKEDLENIANQSGNKEPSLSERQLKLDEEYEKEKYRINQELAESWKQKIEDTIDARKMQHMSEELIFKNELNLKSQQRQAALEKDMKEAEESVIKLQAQLTRFHIEF